MTPVHRPTTSVEMRWNQDLGANPPPPPPPVTLPAAVTRTENVVGRSLYVDCSSMGGKLAELILYNRAVSDDELGEIELYLQRATTAAVVRRHARSIDRRAAPGSRIDVRDGLREGPAVTARIFRRVLPLPVGIVGWRMHDPRALSFARRSGSRRRRHAIGANDAVRARVRRRGSRCGWAAVAAASPPRRPPGVPKREATAMRFAMRALPKSEPCLAQERRRFAHVRVRKLGDDRAGGHGSVALHGRSSEPVSLTSLHLPHRRALRSCHGERTQGAHEIVHKGGDPCGTPCSCSR